MKDSTLCELLSTLDNSEWDDLELFMRSPWCNNYEHPQEQLFLLQYLRGNDAPDKTQAYPLVFPEQRFIENKLEKLMTATLKYVRRWILLRRRDEEAEELIELARFYLEKGLTEKFDLTVANARKSLNNRPKKGLKDYLLQYNLEYEVSTSRTLNNEKRDDANLNTTLLALDRFYIASRLKNTALMVHQKGLVPFEPYAFGNFFPTMLEEVRQDSALYIPIIRMYELVYKMSIQKTGMQEELQILPDLIRQFEQELSDEVLDITESAAVNFCTVQYNSGAEAYLPVLFSIMKRRLDSKRIFVNGLLPAGYLHAIVIPALRLREYEWVKSFLDDIKGKVIGIESPDEAWNYFYARYLFSTGQFEVASDILASNAEKNYLKYGAKILEIQTLYETDQESTLLDSKLDAAKVFFFREKKLSDEKKELYNNFIDIIKQIRNPKTLGNRERVQKLIEKVERIAVVAEKEWVKEKLQDLLGR